MFSLSILTPEKRLVTDQEIDEAIVPGDRGQLDVLPGHAPLITTLRAGVLRYRLRGETAHRSLVVSWGYAEVSPTGVVILAETAETREEIDAKRAEAALKKSTDFLAQLIGDPTELAKYQRKVDRAQARLELVHSDKLSH
jgi:F-type H+-transporting ATPase subunit epsilon